MTARRSRRERKRTLSAKLENIVIAGAGQAGGRAAEALRARGFRGSITMLGDEPHPPYERPQLSKEMLHKADRPVAYIKQARDWNDVLNILLETGAAVTEVTLAEDSCIRQGIDPPVRGESRARLDFFHSSSDRGVEVHP